MERKEFLKQGLGFLGMAIIAPSFIGAKAGSGKKATGTDSCTETNSETAGPFPTITPASLVMNNIIGDRTGVAFTINITVKNINNSCQALQGAIVDIWHCDKDGYYSEYGGTSMQTVDYTSENFLRGRQTTDASGQVSYTSIFPGWYTSRATHIHVHIYDSAGNSLLITQIAFPEGTGSAVELVNSATAYGYSKGMTGYTYNASDNVFSDGVSNELASVAGSVSSGYTLTHEIYVSASATAGLADLAAETQFEVGQNYPNPFVSETVIPVTLFKPSDVRVEVYGIDGRKIGDVVQKGLAAGEQKITFNTGAMSLAGGRYVYSVEVTNSSGTFRQSKIMVRK